MIIPKEQLSGEAVRQVVEQTLRQHLNLAINGDKCDTATVVNVLVKAAIEGQTMESVCEDWALEVGSNTVREHLNALLDAYELREHECAMNAGLSACVPVELPKRGREMAVDMHDEPFYGKAGDIDTAIITLRFANGALCAIDNSRKAAYGYDQRVEAFGSGGAVGVTNNLPNTAVISDADGVHGAKPLYFFLERYTESFIAEMRAFVEAVRENKPVPVGGHDGRMATVIGMAAQKSLREGRPVKLSEI